MDMLKTVFPITDMLKTIYPPKTILREGKKGVGVGVGGGNMPKTSLKGYFDEGLHCLPLIHNVKSTVRKVFK